jgi:hypothetical protein
LISALLVLVSTGFAQGVQKYDTAMVNVAGTLRPVANATVRVCSANSTGSPCTPLANIYSDIALTMVLANPTSADANGNYHFYAVPGVYDIQISGTGVAVYTQTNVSFAVGGAHLNFQQFLLNGMFTIPAGVTAVKATVVGGGGAGGGSTAIINGGGGGSGSVAIKWFSSLTPGNTITVTVGTFGTGVSASAGNPGANSSISSGTQAIATVTAPGGGGGFSIGVISAGGGAGATPTNQDTGSGGTGGGSTYAGTVGGTGAPGIFGGGGQSAIGAVGNIATGAGAGGGGAGAGGNAAGGNGGNGIVIFEWIN